ncbi:hypothetical protein ACFL4E_01390 [Candidatus Omnitrophota bacterium]
MRSPIFKIITVSLMILSLSGCAGDSAEKEKKILAQDPSFQKVLDKRNSMVDELATHKTNYLAKRVQIDEEISTLKEEKSLIRTQYAEEIQRTKRRLNPEKRNLERDLLESERSYKRINSELVDINSDIKEITALIGKKEKLALTQEEMKTWNDRLATLIEAKEKSGRGERETQD